MQRQKAAPVRHLPHLYMRKGFSKMTVSCVRAHACFGITLQKIQCTCEVRALQSLCGGDGELCFMRSDLVFGTCFCALKGVNCYWGWRSQRDGRRASQSVNSWSACRIGQGFDLQKGGRVTVCAVRVCTWQNVCSLARTMRQEMEIIYFRSAEDSVFSPGSAACCLRPSMQISVKRVLVTNH